MITFSGSLLTVLSSSGKNKNMFFIHDSIIININHQTKEIRLEAMLEKRLINKTLNLFIEHLKCIKLKSLNITEK